MADARRSARRHGALGWFSTKVLVLGAATLRLQQSIGFVVALAANVLAGFALVVIEKR